jgi:hypothetical protein
MILSAHAESIILLAGGAESMMLSACAESMILSALPAESMILSACAESMILSVPLAAVGKGGGSLFLYGVVVKKLVCVFSQF